MTQFLVSSLLILSSISFAAQKCKDIVPVSLHVAAEGKAWTDIETDSVVFTKEDAANAYSSYPAPLRPEFTIVLSPSGEHETLVALIPKNSSTSGLIGQQVVQWGKVKVPPRLITGVVDQSADGSVHLRTVANGKLKTNLIVAKKQTIEPVQFNDLVQYVKNNPRELNAEAPSRISNALKLLFGKTWIKIFGPRAKVNSLDASDKILVTQKIINPGKEKFLHVSGEVFSADLTVSSNSPFTGTLAAGQYKILGRLSASIKNLEVRNEKNELEPNSLAKSFLIFRSEKEAETPGVLFLQDSLVPVINTGLSSYQLTNNPAFAFKPKSVREFFEQGFSIFGVALASFKNKRDSGRGLQGNYRSTFGAASNGVDVSQGQNVVAPRFVSVEFNGSYNPSAKSHTESMKENPDAHFVLRSSDDAKSWTALGKISNLDWFGVDSHELTFPHGLSGTIDPQTLKAAASTLAVGGISLPTQIKSLP